MKKWKYHESIEVIAIIILAVVLAITFNASVRTCEVYNHNSIPVQKVECMETWRFEK